MYIGSTIFITQVVEDGDIEICKVASEDNIADPLTKALTQPKHESHVRSMGIRWDHRLEIGQVGDCWFMP